MKNWINQALTTNSAMIFHSLFKNFFGMKQVFLKFNRHPPIRFDIWSDGQSRPKSPAVITLIYISISIFFSFSVTFLSTIPFSIAEL